MKTKEELDKAILAITMKIQKEFPELSKYLMEMPVKFSETNANGVSINNLEDYYNSLKELVKGYSDEHLKINNLKLNEMKQTTDKKGLSGSPVNPPTEDVYDNWKQETEINPEDITKKKTPNEIPGTKNEKDFSDDVSGSDLDIPGAELDDKLERVGSEDEENNYYSIGGDDHNDLEEDKA